jgi:hypothetical protein
MKRAMAAKDQLRKAIGVCIGAAGSIVPALLVSSFFGAHVGRMSMWLPIAAVVCAVAGILVVDDLRDWYLGLVGGFVAGPGAVLLTSWWASWRSSLYSTELLLVALVGALPGFAVAWAIARLADRSARQAREATRQP